MHVEHIEQAPQQVRLTINVSKDDYLPEVDKTIKKLSKTMVVKGFRQGMVPMGMIKKMHGNEILAEELSKNIDNAIKKHIDDNKLDIFGRPLPVENGREQTIDINNPADFVFDYDLGIVPAFDMEIPSTGLVQYDVQVEDKVIDDDIEYYRNRFGNRFNPESISDDDKVKATLTETTDDGAEKEGGIKSEAQFAISAIKDEAIRKQFIGKKTGDTLNINLWKAFDNDEELLAHSILHAEHDALHHSGHIYNVAITEIFNITPAEVNQEFFDKLYGEGTVTDVEGLRQRRREDIAKEFAQVSRDKFANDVKARLVAANNFPLPETFLKKLLLENNAEKLNADNIDGEFPYLVDRLKWDLISNRIARENELSLTADEVRDHVKEIVRRTYLNGNADPTLDELVSNFADRMMEKEEERRRYAEEVLDAKIMAWILERTPVTQQTVSIEEFNKLTA